MRKEENRNGGRWIDEALFLCHSFFPFTSSSSPSCAQRLSSSSSSSHHHPCLSALSFYKSLIPPAIPCFRLKGRPGYCSHSYFLSSILTSVLLLSFSLFRYAFRDSKVCLIPSISKTVSNRLATLSLLASSASLISLVRSSSSSSSSLRAFLSLPLNPTSGDRCRILSVCSSPPSPPWRNLSGEPICSLAALTNRFSNKSQIALFASGDRLDVSALSTSFFQSQRQTNRGRRISVSHDIASTGASRSNTSSPVRMNNRITAETLRVLLEEGREEVLGLQDALILAQQRHCDLIEEKPATDTEDGLPFCRLMPAHKFHYQQAKLAKEEQSKKNGFLDEKEIRVRAQIDTHDASVKRNLAKSVLQRGYSIKFVMRLRRKDKAGGEALFRQFFDTTGCFLKDFGVPQRLVIRNQTVISQVFKPKEIRGVKAKANHAPSPPHVSS